MGDDVIIGSDGKPRCAWVGSDDTAARRYHDDVWGTNTYDESAVFEALTLGVFHGFDIRRVAAMTARDIDRLVQDASIIRNRAKIEATVDNARAMTSASPTLAALAMSYEVNRAHAPRSLTDLPAPTPQATAFAKQKVTGIPVRGTDERLLVHAERRRRQRPPSRLLPSHRFLATAG